MSIVPLTARHVPEAADLVVRGVVRLRRRVPVLPPAWADPVVVGHLLGELAARGTGLAIEDDGLLVAYQAPVLMDGHGGRWSYTPDVGHAAPRDEDGRQRTALYARLAEGWVRDACPEHVMTVLVDDETALAAFTGLGFGHIVVDLVRDLSPVEVPALPDGVFVRRAGADDAGSVAVLDAALRRHLEASPIFLRPAVPAAPEVLRRDLRSPREATFLAERDGHPVAFIRIGPCATDVATVVRDVRTASITGAFTAPDLRGGGVATALLAAAVRWAGDEGFERCAVDHESANGEASRFWARHCTPVAISMARRLPAGIVA